MAGNYPLYPLHIPPQWTVHWNHLETLCPSEVDDWDCPSLSFVEDMAYFQYTDKQGTSWSIDVGFYPENSPEGGFKVYVIKNNDWNCPVLLFETKYLPTLATKVESLFIQLLQQDKD